MMRALAVFICFIIVLGSCETLIDRLDELDEGPFLKIIRPINGFEFLENESVSFECDVSDLQDLFTDLSVQWVSSIDGVFATRRPTTAEGKVKFIYSQLSLGYHDIEVIVTDTDGNTKSASVNLRIKSLLTVTVIDSIIPTRPGLKISWSRPAEPLFKSYKLWRLGFLKLVFESDDINDLEYIDTDVEVGEEYRYVLRVLYNTGDSTESPIMSEVYIGDNIKLDINVQAMVLDPVRPYLYMVDLEGNSLIVVNTETKTIFKRISVGPQPTDLSISIDNSELYVAHLGNSEVQVFDLDQLMPIRSFHIKFEGTPNDLFKLEYMSGHFLACAAEDQWGHLQLFSADNGDFVHDVNVNVNEPSIVSSLDKTTLYAGESNISSSKLFRLEISDSTLVVIEETKFHDFASRMILLSGDGKYLYFDGRKILSSDLTKEFGSFGENITATNYDGSFTLGTTMLFNGQSFQPIREFFDFRITHAVYNQVNNTFIIFVGELQALFFMTID